jgi:DNA invertase Pin-like site-specific DNA recombinase
MKIGYARVSTDDQNPALQIAALKRAECKRIFTDTAILCQARTVIFRLANA